MAGDLPAATTAPAPDRRHTVATWWPPSLPRCDVPACTVGAASSPGQPPSRPRPRPRVVVFSLYGSDPRYTDGAKRNADLMVDLMPDWEMWVLVPGEDVVAAGHPELAVPADVLAYIRARGGRVVPVDRALATDVGFGMNQRFVVAADASVERFAVRDIDSRMLLRDRWALDEWIASGLAFHNERDHPAHGDYSVNGGMWGALGGAVPNMREQLKAYRGGKAKKFDDMAFLHTRIWPVMQQCGVLQHDATNCTRWPGVKPFPRPRAGSEHVGAVMDQHERIRPKDLQAFLGKVEMCPPSSVPAASRDLVHPSAALRCALDSGAGGAPDCVHFGAHNITVRGLIGAVHADPDTCTAAAADDTSNDTPGRCVRSDCNAECAVGVFGLDPTVARASSATPAWVEPQLLLLAWRDVFVDHALAPAEAGCPANLGSGPVPPRIFSYTDLLAYHDSPQGCVATAYTTPLQLHERVPLGTTHYDALGGGIHYHRNLAIVQAAYTTDSALFVSLALPFVAWLLQRDAPERLVVLLPDTLPVASGMHALTAAGWLTDDPAPFATPSRAAGGPSWQQHHSRLRVHLGAPALYWAYQLHAVLVADGMPGLAQLSECLASQSRCASARPEVHAALAQAIVGTARWFDRAKLPPAPPQPVAVLDLPDAGWAASMGPVLRPQLEAAGYRVVEAGVAADAGAMVTAYASAAVVFLPTGFVPPALFLLRPRVAVFELQEPHRSPGLAGPATALLRETWQHWNVQHTLVTADPSATWTVVRDVLARSRPTNT